MTRRNSPALIAPPPFRERAPWFGADLQTIRNMLVPRPAEPPGAERLLLAVSDGDRLSARLDRPAAVEERPLIVLVHGLTGSETSINVVAAARRLISQGWPVLRLNLRGSAPSRPTSKGRYHAGRTEDLAAALHALPTPLMRRGVILVGHSLGGNLILKFMGEGAWDLPVAGAAVVSTPLDLAATCARMMEPRNFVYHRYLLAAMKREALAPGAALTTAQRAAVAQARSVFEFDDRFVAPLFGYRGAEEYYRSNSSAAFLADIALPTLVVHALDDPWIPRACYDAIDWAHLPATETAMSPHGGHLGFHGVGSPVPWHDRVVSAWLRQGFATME
ncbi:alpha/beta fold hydrolase [Methylocystis sp. IM3]|uniref:YheT family hydrolase n=1 Tax=unclassified Methylocystis TaxID=2625913 RepID=UPI0030F7C0AB